MGSVLESQVSRIGISGLVFVGFEPLFHPLRMQDYGGKLEIRLGIGIKIGIGKFFFN